MTEGGRVRWGGRWLPLIAALAVTLAGCTPRLIPSSPDSPSAATVPLQVRIDDRIELMSVIFRLAGAPGYTMNNFQRYVDAIEAHFGSFREHPAVLEARRLMTERGVSFDAPMSLAVHLTPVPDLELRRELRGAALDERWPRETSEAFVRLARDFALASDFDAFLRSNADLYALAESRLQQTVAEHVDLAWFDAFFRESPGGPYTVLIGLSNGGMSYYTRYAEPGGGEEIYAVIGAWKVDPEGFPVFDQSVTPTVVHELVHAYVNPLVDARATDFDEAGRTIYDAVETAMKRQSYGRWDLAVKESLVRSVVARYLLAQHGADAAAVEIGADRERGFLWTDELYALLGVYAGSPGRFATFTAFAPELAVYFRDLAPRIGHMVESYDALRPQVLASTPTLNATGVDPALTELVFRFDRPMDPRRHPLVRQPHDPDLDWGQPTFDEHGTLLRVPVRLEPGARYRFTLGMPDGAFGFADTRGIAMPPLEFMFETLPETEVSGPPERPSSIRVDGAALAG